MSTTTANLGLTKPAASEAADIDVINTNMDLIDTAWGALMSRIYPVGAIYLSTSAVSPATLFGGTWVQIEGRFLLAAGGAYNAGDTGGNAQHTLTVSEMPSHSHAAGVDGADTWYYSLNKFKSGAAGSLTFAAGNDRVANGGVGTDYSNVAIQASTQATGGGAPFNIMPPYLAVYVWKRTE